MEQRDVASNGHFDCVSNNLSNCRAHIFSQKLLEVGQQYQWLSA